MSKKTIEIFRAGTHVGIDGKSYTFTADDVRGIANRYDPLLFSAPAVVGHPKHDDPAYGWADALQLRDDGVLCADLDKVDPAFADAVEAGRYRKVSAAFYPAEHPNNPTPGQMYLRHIGFLGAAAPGVSGLAPVAFAESDTDFIAFATDEELRPLVWLARNMGRMFRRMRDQLIEDKGIEEADKILPAWEADAPAEIAAQLDVALSGDNGPRFAAPADKPAPAIPDAAIAAAELASREAAIVTREAEVKRRELAFSEGERDARLKDDGEFLDGLINQGRLPPGHKEQVIAFCDRLAGGDLIAFAEGAKPQDLRLAFRDMLGGLGVTIRFDEIAGGDGLKFAEGQSAEELGQRARARVAEAQSRGESLSVSAAMAEITTGR